MHDILVPDAFRLRSVVVSDVEVWAVSLDAASRRSDEFVGILSEEERVRASCFAFVRDRRRFVTTRGVLRVLLSRYLCCAPERVRFRYEACGRPEVEAAPATGSPFFNVSHGSDIAVIAISGSHRVGIDVEQIRPIPEVEAIVREHFSPRERKEWEALPQQHKLEAFHQAWTRKEAVLKALGVGIAGLTHGIEVTFGAKIPERLMCIHGDRRRAAEWSLISLRPALGYVGALAVPPSIHDFFTPAGMGAMC